MKRPAIALIAHYRKNNKRRHYEDERKIRGLRRSWIVERTNTRLGQFRRWHMRHEHLLSAHSAEDAASRAAWVAEY